MFSNHILTRLIERKGLQLFQPRNISEQASLFISSSNTRTCNDHVSRLSTRSLCSDVMGRCRPSTRGSLKSDVRNAFPSIQRTWRGKESITASESSLFDRHESITASVSSLGHRHASTTASVSSLLPHQKSIMPSISSLLSRQESIMPSISSHRHRHLLLSFVTPLSYHSVRRFCVSTKAEGRHWWDTIRDDDNLDRRFDNPLYSKGESNPKPYEMELELRAYRLEQEEKYRGLRPMLVLYLIVGSICGYISCDSYRETAKAKRVTRWMTPEVGEKLSPMIRASVFAGVVYVAEFCESCGSLGAHLPFYVWGSYATVFVLKYIYHEIQEFLFD